MVIVMELEIVSANKNVEFSAAGPKFHLARHDSTLLDTSLTWPVELVVLSVSNSAVRHAQHSQNAWAQHVESCQDVM